MKYIIELFPKYSLYYLKLAFLMTLISQNTMYYLEKQLLGEKNLWIFYIFEQPPRANGAKNGKTDA